MNNGDLQTFVMDFLRNTKDGKALGDRIIDNAVSEYGVSREDIEMAINDLAKAEFIKASKYKVFLELNV